MWHLCATSFWEILRLALTSCAASIVSPRLRSWPEHTRRGRRFPFERKMMPYALLLLFSCSLLPPSHVSRIVKLWRKDLEKVNPKAAESLADPMDYENLFPDIKLVQNFFLHVEWKILSLDIQIQALQAEKLLQDERKHNVYAAAYPDLKDAISRDMIAGACVDDSVLFVF